MSHSIGERKQECHVGKDGVPQLFSFGRPRISILPHWIDGVPQHDTFGRGKKARVPCWKDGFPQLDTFGGPRIARLPHWIEQVPQHDTFGRGKKARVPCWKDGFPQLDTFGGPRIARLPHWIEQVPQGVPENPRCFTFFQNFSIFGTILKYLNFLIVQGDVFRPTRYLIRRSCAGSRFLSIRLAGASQKLIQNLINYVENLIK
jgi:hypothetical protein